MYLKKKKITGISFKQQANRSCTIYFSVVRIMKTLGFFNDLLSEYDIVLASSSPRRYEIMHDIMGIQNLRIMTPDFQENLDKKKYTDNPVQYACDTSLHKAESIMQMFKSAPHSTGMLGKKIVVCADTILIDNENNIYEKPKDKAAQLTYLKKFCYDSKYIRVVTGVAIINWVNSSDHKIFRFHDETKLYFDETIPLGFLKQYVESGAGLEAAGGFKIQDFSGSFIKEMKGDYYNVVGLPLNKVLKTIWQELSI